MRTLQLRSLSLPALAFLVFAGSAAAQDKSAALLNTVEVQQLVKRAEPGDNARLAAHFTALADRYAAEAKRHTSMAQSFVGVRNPQSWDRHERALQATRGSQYESATELRELATIHQKLASGAAATQPAAGARFEGGAGATVPTERSSPL